jgi:hypothetical protein
MNILSRSSVDATHTTTFHCFERSLALPVGAPAGVARRSAWASRRAGPVWHVRLRAGALARANWCPPTAAFCLVEFERLGSIVPDRN